MKPLSKRNIKIKCIVSACMKTICAKWNNKMTQKTEQKITCNEWVAILNCESNEKAFMLLAVINFSD